MVLVSLIVEMSLSVLTVVAGVTAYKRLALVTYRFANAPSRNPGAKTDGLGH